MSIMAIELCALILFIIVSMGILAYSPRVTVFALLVGMCFGGLSAYFGYRILGYTGFLGNFTVMVGLGIAGVLGGKLLRSLKKDREQGMPAQNS